MGITIAADTWSNTLRHYLTGGNRIFLNADRRRRAIEPRRAVREGVAGIKKRENGKRTGEKKRGTDGEEEKKERKKSVKGNEKCSADHRPPN